MSNILESHYRNVLNKAIKEGTLQVNDPLEAVAKYFVSSLYGLRVFNKTKSTIQERHDVLNAILAILEQRVIS